MENSDFDKYIRSHTEKDLTPPMDLNWENMNIPLPSEKKKDRAIYFYFIGLLILVGGLYLFSNQYSTTQDDIVEQGLMPENNISLESKTSVNKELEAEKQYNSENIENEKESIVNLNSNTSKEFLIQKTKKNSSSISQNRMATQQNISKKNIESQFVPTNQSALSKASFNKMIKKDLTKDAIDIEKITQPKNKLSQPLAINSIVFTFLPFTNETQYVDIPLRWETKDFKRESLNNGLTLQLGYGLNTFQSNFNPSSQTELLQSAEDIAYGHAVNLKLKYHFKHKIYASLGFTYQKLHNTFSYREDLGVVNNLVDFTKVHRTKVIYHNNYFENISINIGVGKAFLLTKYLGFDIALQLNPTLGLSSEGRTLNDELQVVYIENFQPSKKLFLSAGTSIDVFYKVKNNKIFAGAGFTQTLSKVNLIQNSNLSYQPRILTFNIGFGRRF